MKRFYLYIFLVIFFLPTGTLWAEVSLSSADKDVSVRIAVLSRDVRIDKALRTQKQEQSLTQLSWQRNSRVQRFYINEKNARLEEAKVVPFFFTLQPLTMG